MYRSHRETAFAFAYIERLLKTPEASRAAVVQAALKQVEQTSKLLQGVGYETLVYEDFYDALVHMIKRIVNAAPDAPQLTQRGLLEAFNDAPSTSSRPPQTSLCGMLSQIYAQRPTRS